MDDYDYLAFWNEDLSYLDVYNNSKKPFTGDFCDACFTAYKMIFRGELTRREALRQIKGMDPFTFRYR